MNILFVSGAPFGGAAKSTHELARRLAERGHEASVLIQRAGARRQDYVYKRSVNLRVRVDRRNRRLGRGVDAFCRRVGRRMRSVPATSGYRTWTAVVPENALPDLTRAVRPDVVVVCSVSRVAWKAIHAHLRSVGIPVVLYIRERTSVRQMEVAEPDLLLANAKAHAAAAAAAGHRCLVVPSIVDLEAARTETTRQSVVLVNPIPQYGLDTAMQLARRRPDVPIVLQESWVLPDETVAELSARARDLGNVELRRFSPDVRRIYSDAAVLLVPYAEDNRPRVVAEAQVSGIPVLAAASPSLEEAVGPGGLLVPHEAPPEAWAEALGRLWDEPETYARLSEAARSHSQRPELQPATIVSDFEHIMQRLLTANRGPRAMSETS